MADCGEVPGTAAGAACAGGGCIASPEAVRTAAARTANLWDTRPAITHSSTNLGGSQQAKNKQRDAISEASRLTTATRGAVGGEETAACW
jgi:hypothetical protein